MTTNKKILAIVISILGIAAISTVAAFSFFYLAGLHFWGVFGFATLVQILAPWAAERYTFSQEVQNTVKEYANKPFRKYEIPLTCQYCGHSEPVDIDLTNTTYKCSTCERKNAVYVYFQTAVMQNEQP